MKTNTILNRDALTRLKELPEKSINMCMTSPPYWALRDYGVEGQLGLEKTFDEYINKLCNIFDEVKRVLRDDGTCWVNIGDTYYGSSSYSNEGRAGFNPKDGNTSEWKRQFGNGKCLTCGKSCKTQFCDRDCLNKQGNDFRSKNRQLPDKCLIMIPMRFVIEMVNRGWILRNTIIWHKKNCMPSSAKDRFTVDFEYIFFFSKKKKYYFEQQLEPHTTNENRPNGIVREREFGYDTKYPEVRRKKPLDENNPYKGKGWEGSVPGGGAKIVRDQDPRWLSPDGRNKRTVWTINPKPFSEAHFAVYPEELCETPIKAGCPKYVCVKCRNPKILEIEYSGGTIGNSWHDHSDDLKKGMLGREGIPSKTEKPYERKIKGYKPTCKCNTDFTGGIVLDPFFGAGTTGVVALKQNKEFVGIELNEEYIEIAKKRLKPYLEQTKLSH